MVTTPTLQNPGVFARACTRGRQLISSRAGRGHTGDLSMSGAAASAAALRDIQASPLRPSSRSRGTVAVAQTPGGLTEAFLRAGSKKPQVVARPRRALPDPDAASPLSDRHSERGRGFRRRLCATATTNTRRLDCPGRHARSDMGIGSSRASKMMLLTRMTIRRSTNPIKSSTTPNVAMTPPRPKP